MPVSIANASEGRLAGDMLVDGAAAGVGEDTKKNVTVGAASESASPLKLETIISDIECVIEHLQPVAGDTHTARWHASLKMVREEAARKHEVLIAFVGATGAGKSSLINALLGDHIVPTSGVKSCTSTPILISYHDEEQVRAKIEFVSAESWLEEVRLFLEALAEAGGVLARLADDGKEAWHRVRVVYPKLTAQMLLRLTAAQVLATDAHIASKLGTTVSFDAGAAGFKDELQHYTRARRDDSGDLWPLIAQISIRCRAPVLESGVSLVDLPGVLDSNAARAAVASEYMKRCDNVFVVAPIKRAATDQVARDLMGDAFKTQLMNGKYSADCIALIATCNDDILSSEIVSEFNINWVPEWVSLQNQLGLVEAEMNTVSGELEQLREQMLQDNSNGMCLEDLVPSHAGGTIATLKRSTDDIVMGQSPTKKQKIYDSAMAAGTVDPALLQLQCLPGDHTLSAVSNDPLAPAVTTRASLGKAIAVKETRMLALTRARDDLNQQCTKFCAQWRSNWTREELQGQFKEGHIALYEPVDLSENGADDQKDINVFSVSARDYMKLSGKSPLDGASLVFQTIEETGVPAVIEFCRQIGQRGSRIARHRLALQLYGIVVQLESYVSLQSRGAHAGESQAEGATPQDLQASMSRRITASIREVTDSTHAKVLHDLDSVLFPQMVQAAAKTAGEVSAYIRKLAKPIRYWRTLKAICRRDGSWKEHDWNNKTVGLMATHFASAWSRVLALRCLRENPLIISSSIETVLDMLDASSQSDKRSKVSKLKSRILAQVESHSRRANDKCRSTIRSGQAEISRAMQQKMKSHMRSTYQRAHALSGIGYATQALNLICQDLDKRGIDIFNTIVKESVDALRSVVLQALSGYSDSLSKLPALIDNQLLSIIVLQDGISESPLQEDQAELMGKLEVITESIRSYEGTGDQQAFAI